MTNRERVLAILNYDPYDRMPVVHFGYWPETLKKWASEGHISLDDAESWADATPICKRISGKLGFDFAWFNTFPDCKLLFPSFESKILREKPDGSKEYFNSDGVVVVEKDESGSIPSEILHSLKNRKSWEELYKPKLVFTSQSIEKALVNTEMGLRPFDQGGLEYLKNTNRQTPVGLMVGSLLGRIRCWLGVIGLSYLIYDDEKLLDEMIKTVSDLCHKRVEFILESGAKFEFAHYWEDICFKNGSLISPEFFADKIGPHYKKITQLLHRYDIKLISVDCDGYIDQLIPTWLSNGVNTMFPIEVGTWQASIQPWRQKYGKQLRGVGGMNKTVFSHDRREIDAEIERLKTLVDLGGYIPCPDHRIDPNAKWDNVRYYCDRMHEFG